MHTDDDYYYSFAEQDQFLAKTMIVMMCRFRSTLCHNLIIIFIFIRWMKFVKILLNYLKAHKINYSF